MFYLLTFFVSHLYHQNVSSWRGGTVLSTLLAPTPLEYIWDKVGAPYFLTKLMNECIIVPLIALLFLLDVPRSNHYYLQESYHRELGPLSLQIDIPSLSES